jgi:AAA domain
MHSLDSMTRPDADHWSREARAPLPDALRVLALEYSCDERLLSPRYDDEGRRQESPTPDPEEFLNYLGLVSRHEPAETTLFGGPVGDGRVRFRLDIVAKQLSLAQFAPSKIKKTFGDFARGVKLDHHKILKTWAHRSEISDEAECDWYYYGGGNDDPEDAPGVFARWATDKAQSFDDFMRLLDACNGKIAETVKILREHRKEPAGLQQYLVEGLIAKGVTTLLLGAKGVGKTNAALELAVAAAERKSTWLGFPLTPKLSGFVYYLYGEDAAEDIKSRVRAMNDGRMPLMLKLIRYNGKLIKDVVKEIGNDKVDLVVVDPARKFYKGDEDSSDPVSAFFTEIENLAHDKKSAVVINHHLKRGGEPKNIHDVPRCMRGSQVWIDRPRTILAMHRAGNATQIGIPVVNGIPLHNLKTSIMFAGVRRLRRDEATFQHVPIDDAVSDQKKPDRRTADNQKRVLIALAHLIKKDARVTTGRVRELFTWNAPDLKGMSRATVRRTVKQLLADGKIVLDETEALKIA